MYDQVELKISSGKNRIAVTKFTPRDVPVRKRIISLHGAGNAIRQRTFYLADMLTVHGGEFVSFDFSGHGESTGTLAESSLKLRKEEALDVINEVLGGEPDVVMGNSMGGYIALELLSELTPEAMILLCPAMYSSDAFDVPFTEKFTSILREPQSYRNNHAAAKLQRYRGRVMLAIGAEDNVIPGEVMDIYRSAAISAEKISDLVIPDAPHVLHLWAAANPTKASEFLENLSIFIFGAD